MQDSLQKLLYKKYLDKNLASLYIAKYDSQFIDPQSWVNNFLHQITPLADHPDVLKVEKSPEDTLYKVDSQGIKNFLKFLNYHPLKLEKKFIFLFDAQDLSVIVSNKLLKIFEELSSQFCLILMVPDNAQLLPTVLSRAIKVQIPKSEQSIEQDLFDVGSIDSPLELMNYLKSNSTNPQFDEKRFIESALSKVLNSISTTPEAYNRLEALLKVLESYERASDFNNAKMSRLTPFFS